MSVTVGPSVPARAGIMLEMIKFQHTVFALPFALTGLVLAARASPGSARWVGVPVPSARVAVLALACCVAARTAAMAYNRWADAAIDAANPRTAGRAIPAGLLSGRSVLLVALASSAAFVGFAALLNPLAAALSPVALAVLLGYSYCKRFTAACHFVLGLALAIAPIGAWVAVRAEIAATPLLLGAAVLLWTAGFDIIYACQDAGFDREAGLFSMPARMGVGPALWISRLCHVVAVAAWVALAGVAGLGWPYLAGVALVAALLGLEHWLVRGGDLSRIDAAFFTVNSWVGVAMLAAVVAGVV